MLASISEDPNNWPAFLQDTILAYNHAMHSTTKMEPAVAFYYSLSSITSIEMKNFLLDTSVQERLSLMGPHRIPDWALGVLENSYQARFDRFKNVDAFARQIQSGIHVLLYFLD